MSAMDSRPLEAAARRAGAGDEGAKPEEVRRLLEGLLRSLVSEALPREGGQLYRRILAQVEGPLLRHALELSGGNQLKAARLLGINRNTLRKRLRLLGLLPPRDRAGQGRA